MTDNIEEEHLDIPINTPSEKLSDEITSTKDTDISIPNQETENMEVHKHPHHVTHKKKWGEYLLEFLMLFLAVFLGFVAENIREQSVERNREKEFIQSFIEDLKTDTASINQNIIFRYKKLGQLDSLVNLLSEQKIKGYENELYYLARSLVRNTRFQSNDRTITQLKNSGSLRLIRNEQAADSMISYQKLVEYINLNQDDDRIERRNVDPILSRMFNSFIFYKMVDITGINKPTDNPPLRSYDPAIQQDLAYYLDQIKGSTLFIEARLKLLNDKAKNIITFLQKEYHLE